MESKVYFTKNLNKEGLIKIYQRLNPSLKGNIAIKLHSGEEGNQNYLTPEYLKPLIDLINGTVVECNTAYGGARNTSEKHLKLIKEHGWSKYFKFDLMDENDDDLVLDIPNGHVLKKDFVGGHLKNYDSMIVISHFKGHPMGGYGGALKQLSIGVASSRGKAYIHSAGRTTDQHNLWEDLPPQNKFLEAMSDAASSVHNYFKGNICYISILKNISVDCDCCAVAEDPCMQDIGVLASFDPVAIDQAAIDLVYGQTNDPGLSHFKERVESRNGRHTIDASASLGFGSKDYALINIDE